MSQPPQDSHDSPPVTVGVDAVAATAGSGTLAFVIAQTLPDPYRFWLSALAPTISAASGAMWVFLRTLATRRWRKREMDSAIKKAKQTLQAAIDNDKTSATHRAKLRKDLEELELLEVRSDLRVAKARIKKREEDA